MGCDIHMFVEKKKNNKWVAVKGDYKNWKDETITTLDWFYDGRDYVLFSILADVRNDFQIKPLSEPKGIPHDISDEVRREYDIWEGDGHSHSWYTFDELINFDYENKTIEHEAFVSEEVYKKFKETGDPYPCSKGVGGSKVEIVLNCEMERIIKNKYFFEQDKSFYTAIKWVTTYKESMEYFLENLTDYIEKEKIHDHELSNYRLVFWFDN